MKRTRVSISTNQVTELAGGLKDITDELVTFCRSAVGGTVTGFQVRCALRAIDSIVKYQTALRVFVVGICPHERTNTAHHPAFGRVVTTCLDCGEPVEAEGG